MSHDITVKFTREDLLSVLVSAVEGGASEWAEFRNYDPDAGTVEVCENNDTRTKKHWGEWHKVNLTVLKTGIASCAAADSNEGGWAFGAFMKDRTGDAETADCFLQFALFEKLVYG